MRLRQSVWAHRRNLLHTDILIIAVERNIIPVRLQVVALKEKSTLTAFQTFFRWRGAEFKSM